MRIDFFFDPICPFTWGTSRWLTDAVSRRDDVTVRWRTFSLALASGDDEADRSDGAQAGLRGLRVVEAVWADHGDGPIGALYTALGTRIHHDGDTLLEGMGDALQAAGMDLSYAEQADQPRWDTEVRASMADATDEVGTDVGVPIMVVADGDRVGGAFGPVLSAVPVGAEADQLLDVVSRLVLLDAFTELKRSHDGAPALPPRPA